MGYESTEERIIAELRAANTRLHDELTASRSEASRLAATVERITQDLYTAEAARVRALGTLDAFRSFLAELFTELIEHANDLRHDIRTRTSQLSPGADPALHDALTSGAELVLEANARLYTRLQAAVTKVGQ